MGEQGPPNDGEPHVSVVVAAFNAENTIQDCIESLLNQTLRSLEIIVVDDGSTDRTADIVESYVGDRLSLYRLAENRGVAAARNLAADKARGHYLAILDADDIAFPERMEMQARLLDEKAEIGLVGTFFALESELGDAAVVGNPIEHDDIRRSSALACPIANTTMMVRRSLFHDVGGYPEAFRHGEDYRFLAAALRHSRATNIPQVLVTKRELKSGLTFNQPPVTHFRAALGHRLFAVRTLGLGLSGYIEALAASFGVLLIRLTGVNRESIKACMGIGGDTRVDI